MGDKLMGLLFNVVLGILSITAFIIAIKLRLISWRADFIITAVIIILLYVVLWKKRD